MKRVLWAALLALPFAAQTAHAQNCGPYCAPPMKLDGGVTLNFSLLAGGNRSQLGPWYQYWPYAAHFQQGPPLCGASPGMPFMTLPPQGVQAGVAAPAPAQGWIPPAPTPVAPAAPPANRPTQPAVFQPVGYTFTTNAAVPSYWYGK
jgi:hypothetical protein